MEFKDRFKQLRLEKCVSISTLSKDLNISRFAIMKWEKGESKPTMKMQIKLCEYFNVTSDYLMCISDERGFVQNTLDPFIVDMSLYSSSLNAEQKEFILELTKKAFLSNKKRFDNKLENK